MKKRSIALMMSMVSGIAMAGGVEDDPVLAKLSVDKFEYRNGEDSDHMLVIAADAWIGRDLHKLWFKTEVERVEAATEEAEVQLLYSRAVSPFWDAQIGWRHDSRPKPNRDWLALGVKGTAPYLIEMDAALFYGESGQLAARLDAEYEYMITQRLVLIPEIEMNFHSKNDEATGTGSGLSNIELGIRLGYEIKREFAPYLGINWSKKFGDTADFAEEEGESSDDVQFVAGVRFWF